MITPDISKDYDILHRLIFGIGGSCSCLTKTHEVKYHTPLCKYRLLMDAHAEIVKLRQEIDTLKKA